MARTAFVPRLQTDVPGFNDVSDRLPMPNVSEGINNIMNVSAESSKAMVQAMASRGLDLGNLVGGNNATVMPPAQRASGMNAAALALASAGVCAAIDSKSASGAGKDSAKGGAAPVAEKKTAPAGTPPKTNATTEKKAAGTTGESKMVTDSNMDLKSKGIDVPLIPTEPVYAPEKAKAVTKGGGGVTAKISTQSKAAPQPSVCDPEVSSCANTPPPVNDVNADDSAA